MHIVILFSTSLPPCDGIATHVINLARRLQAREHTITLLTRGGARQSSTGEFDGFKVVYSRFLPLYPFHIGAHGYFLAKDLAAISPEPDLIHAHSPLVPVPQKNWPLVSTIHTPMAVDTAQSEGRGLRVLINKVLGQTFSYWNEQALLSASDKVLTVSEGVADELREHYGFEGSITAIPNILDLDFYCPAPEPSEDPNVLFVGRLAYRKGVFEALQAAEIVRKKHPDVRFRFAGYGPLEQEVQEFVSSRSLEDHVELLGAVKDRKKIVALQQEARVVLVPSYYEGCPYSLLEAMACGNAIVSTKAKFTQGLIEDGVTGLLVEPRKAEPLAEAICELLENYERCKALGNSVRVRAESLLGEKRNTDMFEQAYDEAVAIFNNRK